MSDNEDLLGDDLGDHSLADYNLGNEEEEQLLADDYETSSSQNVPTSIGPSYGNVDMVSTDYSSHTIQYNTSQTTTYQQIADTECVVPNITVEVPNVRHPDHSTYAPYEPPVYEPENAVVPPAIPAAPLESPQIVPTDVPVPVPDGEDSAPRARFRNERAVGAAHRAPLVRDIPDTLDKVLIPRGGGFVGRGRSSWRNPHYQPRYNHPYRRNNMPRGNFNQRQSFPPPQMRPSPPQIRPEIHPEIRQNIRPEFMLDMRPEIRPAIHAEMRPEPHSDIRPDMRADMRPNIRPDIRPDVRPDLRMNVRPDGRPDVRPDMHSEVHEMRSDIRSDCPDIRLEPMHQMPPRMGPEISPERPILSEMQFRPENRFGPGPRPNFRPNIEDRSFRPRPPYHYPRSSAPGFEPRAFGPHIREIAPNDVSHMPQVTIRQQLPMSKMEKFGPGPKPREQEVIMLPVQLPPNLPPGGLAGKKVLINPHFKGNFQPPVEGPVKDIDDAAERFIAEQRNALARAANRKIQPQRYIENTTIEIENDLMGSRRSDSDLELLRRQEEFIHANRAGLRRRMRSPSPARRTPSPRRSPDRRHRPERLDRPDRPERPQDEDSEYKRRLREQETMRERVLRAKEVRRRKNAVALQKQLDERERERQDKAKDPTKPEESKDKQPDKPTSTEDTKPDTTRKSPEKEIKMIIEEKIVKEEKVEKIRERSPIKEEKVEVNSTCEGLTPPRTQDLTPPLPRHDSDDDLDLILGDIDGILSDDDTTPPVRSAPPATTITTTDLRSKLPAKSNPKPPRQKIVFHESKEKTPPRRAVVTSSTKAENSENNEKKNSKAKSKAEVNSNKSRPRIIFDNKEKAENDGDDKRTFANRRVILQRTITKDKAANVRDDAESMRPGAGMFSRAVRTAINDCGRRSPEVVTHPAPMTHSAQMTQVTNATRLATVSQLPPGMTHARLRALAGSQLQSLNLDKEERVAKITFNTSEAAETFKKKFNNKMVAASKLVVTLH